LEDIILKEEDTVDSLGAMTRLLMTEMNGYCIGLAIERPMPVNSTPPMPTTDGFTMAMLPLPLGEDSLGNAITLVDSCGDISRSSAGVYEEVDVLLCNPAGVPYTEL